MHVDDWEQLDEVKAAGVRVDEIDGVKAPCEKPATKRTAPRNRYTGLTMQESWWKIRKNGYRNVSFEVRLDGLEYICKRVFTSDRRCAEQRKVLSLRVKAYVEDTMGALKAEAEARKRKAGGRR